MTEHVRVGTSGFSYAGWKGRFYPERLPAQKMLAYYAERVATVEINNTFYKTPAREMLVSWANSVPEGFRFAFKASRYFSSKKGMTNAAAPLERLFGALCAVGDKLGPVLVQLPPPVKKDTGLLREFLAALPHGRRVAIDFRDASWRSDEVYELLRARDVAMCTVEQDDGAASRGSGRRADVATASWGYVRLRKNRYDKRSLDGWEARLRALKLEEAFVFFRHDETGDAAKHALALQRRFRGAP